MDMNDQHDDPHFFTVIVSPATQLHKLEIPKKFVKDQGNRLPDFALLHIPAGENFKVKLLKLNHRVFLHNGWNQFATNYSVQAGSFLVFKLHGRSKFQVIIFDPKSALEIDYKAANLNQIAKENGEFEALKHGIITVKDELEEGVFEEDAKLRISPLERAKGFQSAKPNFIIQIRKRNLSFNSGPGLPTNHCRAHFKLKDGNGKIILIVNNKPWTVNYRIEKMHEFCISMAFGWREFALENKLQEGDICVFEMIKSRPKTYYVHLFRVSDKKIVKPIRKDEKIKDNTPSETSGRKRRCFPRALMEKMAKPILKDEDIKDNNPTEASGRKRRSFPRALMVKAKDFVRNSPGFIIIISNTYFSSCSPSVQVPASHSKQHLKDEGHDLNAITINGEDGKAWIVRYRIGDSYPRLGVGWAKFRSDNDLQIGDVCAFKLINEARKIYKLAIFRGDGK